MTLLTIKEVAVMCKLSESTIRRHIRQGYLIPVYCGPQAVRITPTDLEVYLEYPPISEVGSVDKDTHP
jgi:excisionase family DNA binding protein